MRKLQVDANRTFLKNLKAFESDKKIIVNEGGMGSGKTYAILEIIIFHYCLNRSINNKVISIVRETLREARPTVMRDFFIILEKYDLYNPDNHNKTDSAYHIGSNVVEFLGMDQAHKKRGARRDLLYVNEATGLALDDWIQLSGRTRGKIFIDYNPTFTEHEWIDPVIDRDDSILIKSTYRDNRAFLSSGEITEIENLINVDEYYHKVYALGERAVLKGLIFTNCKVVDSFPDESKWVCYGLDWGFTNDPTALIKVGYKADNIYLQEMIYEHEMTNQDLHNRFLSLGLSKNDEIIADSAEPKSIADLRRYGWNIKAAEKGRDSVNAGIDLLKRQLINIVKDSSNMRKESNNYKWKEHRDGSLLNEPVDKFNHGWDATRYVALAKLNRPIRRKKAGLYG